MTLLALCAPVWFRSSRLTKMRAPPKCRVRFSAKVSGVGRQEYSPMSVSYSFQKLGSACAAANAASRSRKVAVKVSGTYAPPKRP